MVGTIPEIANGIRFTRRYARLTGRSRTGRAGAPLGPSYIMLTLGDTYTELTPTGLVINQALGNF